MAVLALTRRGEEKLPAGPQESPSFLADSEVMMMIFFQSLHNSTNDRSMGPQLASFLPFTQPF